jgi:predicted glycosyltransferase
MHGGYNALTDILATRTPAVILIRAFEDAEQQDHVTRLARSATTRLRILDEDRFEASELEAALRALLQSPQMAIQGVRLNGAETAARFIVEKL